VFDKAFPVACRKPGIRFGGQGDDRGGFGNTVERMTASTTTLLILGASGDLSSRLLLPALGQLLPRTPERRLRLLGAGAEDWDRERWRAQLRESFDAEDASGEAVDAVLEQSEYRKADVTDSGELQRLLDACEGSPALYFALPPAITAKACEQL